MQIIFKQDYLEPPNEYSHSGPGCNGHEGVLNTPHRSRTGTSTSDEVLYPEYPCLFGMMTPFFRVYNRCIPSPNFVV